MNCHSISQLTKTCILLASICTVLLYQGSCALSADEGHCEAEDARCEMNRRENRYESSSRADTAGVSADQSSTTNEAEDESLPSQFLHRGMQGLEGMFDQVASSKEQMMKQLDSVMDKMTESRDKVMEGLDSVMDKMSKSKEQVMEKVREGIDKVAHSKMMEEIDHVIETVAHSKVMEEIRALPRELRESFILSARNQSYLISGLLVAISAAILFLGATYYAWCHHDAWSYHIGSVDEAKALLRKAKQSAEKCMSTAASNMPTGDCQADGSESDGGSKDAPKTESEIALDPATRVDSNGSLPSVASSPGTSNGHVTCDSEDTSTKGHVICYSETTSNGHVICDSETTSNGHVICDSKDTSNGHVTNGPEDVLDPCLGSGSESIPKVLVKNGSRNCASVEVAEAIDNQTICSDLPGDNKKTQ